MESAIAIKDLHKARAIIGADYSEYPNPLREFLEYRKAVYINMDKFYGHEGDNFDDYVTYCEDKIKQLLAL